MFVAEREAVSAVVTSGWKPFASGLDLLIDTTVRFLRRIVVDENDLLVDYPDFAKVIANQEGKANVLDSVVGLQEESGRIAKVLARCTVVLLRDITSEESLFEEVSSSILVVFMFGVWLGQRGLAKL